MINVLTRLVEAAKVYRPIANHLHLTGRDGDLTIQRFGNPNLAWMLGFVTLPKTERGVVAGSINVTTIKYIGKTGSPGNRKMTDTVGVYQILSALRQDLVTKETISCSVGDELLDFADFVVLTNNKTLTGYILSENDISEYNHRHPDSTLDTVNQIT